MWRLWPWTRPCQRSRVAGVVVATPSVVGTTPGVLDNELAGHPRRAPARRRSQHRHRAGRTVGFPPHGRGRARRPGRPRAGCPRPRRSPPRTRPASGQALRGGRRGRLRARRRPRAARHRRLRADLRGVSSPGSRSATPTSPTPSRRGERAGRGPPLPVDSDARRSSPPRSASPRSSTAPARSTTPSRCRSGSSDGCPAGSRTSPPGSRLRQRRQARRHRRGDVGPLPRRPGRPVPGDGSPDRRGLRDRRCVGARSARGRRRDGRPGLDRLARCTRPPGGPDPVRHGPRVRLRRGRARRAGRRRLVRAFAGGRAPGVVQLVTTIDPEVVVVGGEVLPAAEVFAAALDRDRHAAAPAPGGVHPVDRRAGRRGPGRARAVTDPRPDLSTWDSADTQVARRVLTGRSGMLGA